MTDFGPLVSGEEAASLREGATTGQRGRWDAWPNANHRPLGSEPPYFVGSSGHGSSNIACVYSRNSRSNAALIAAAPRLAYTVERQAVEIERLRGVDAIAAKASYFLADGSMRLPSHVAIWMRELLAARSTLDTDQPPRGDER